MIEEITAYSAIIAGFTVATISFYISTKYRKLSLSFVFLGGSFLSYGLVETYWYILDFQGIEPYGSSIDILYVMYYILGTLHIISTLKALKVKMSIEDVVMAVVIVAALLGAYSVLSVDMADNEMFAYGGSLTAMASMMAVMAIITIIKIYHTMLSRSWLLIGFAILIASLADVWYFTQENLTGYEYGDFPLMDGLWFATDIMMIVGIVLHRRRI